MAAVRVFLMHVKYGLNVFPCTHTHTNTFTPDSIGSKDKLPLSPHQTSHHIASESSEKLPNSQVSRLFGCIGGGEWQCKDDRKLGICSTCVLVVVVMVLTNHRELQLAKQTRRECRLEESVRKANDISFGGGECT
jgi:hypothetical protein